MSEENGKKSEGCPLYGHAYGIGTLIPTRGNQCPLVAHAHSPCLMEVAGTAPNWASCPLNDGSQQAIYITALAQVDDILNAQRLLAAKSFRLSVAKYCRPDDAAILVEFGESQTAVASILPHPLGIQILTAYSTGFEVVADRQFILRITPPTTLPQGGSPDAGPNV